MTAHKTPLAGPRKTQAFRLGDVRVEPAGKRTGPILGDDQPEPLSSGQAESIERARDKDRLDKVDGSVVPRSRNNN